MKMKLTSKILIGVFISLCIMCNFVTAMTNKELLESQTGNVQIILGTERSVADAVIYVKPANDTSSWIGFPIVSSDSGFFNGERLLPGDYVARIHNNVEWFHVDVGITTRVTFRDYHPNTNLHTICSTLGTNYEYEIYNDNSFSRGLWIIFVNPNHEDMLSNAIVITYFNSTAMDTRIPISNVVKPGITSLWIDLPSKEIPSGYVVEFKEDTCEQIPGLI